MKSSRSAGCATLAVVAAASLALTTVASATPTVIGHSGRWLTDPAGRVFVIHGTAISTKGYGNTLAAPGPNLNNAHLSLMQSYGINAVRLTFERYQYEPKPGQFNPAYIDEFRHAIASLWSRGIRSLIDFHQDDFGPYFNGNGFPAWMTVSDGLPNLKTLPFPTQYFVNQAQWHAWDHFWANDPDAVGHGHLIDDDIAILTHAVAGMESEPGLLGFEIMNEPFAGSMNQTCAAPAVGCAQFEQTKLSPYYARVIAALRQIDPRQLIFYEPQVAFDFGAPTYVRPPKDPELAFAFHEYCLQGTGGAGTVPGPVLSASCEYADHTVQADALAHVQATGNGLLNTEWGAINDPGMLTNIANLFDQNMISWMYWNYNDMVNQPGGDGLTPTPKPRPEVVHALVRPYPQLIAGTPAGWSFDPSTERFTVRYTTTRVGTHRAFPAGSRTTIFVPMEQYPSGYDVSVTGGRVVSPARSSALSIASCPGARDVTVTVTRHGSWHEGCGAAAASGRWVRVYWHLPKGVIVRSHATAAIVRGVALRTGVRRDAYRVTAVSKLGGRLWLTLRTPRQKVRVSIATRLLTYNWQGRARLASGVYRHGEVIAVPVRLTSTTGLTRAVRVRIRLP